MLKTLSNFFNWISLSNNSEYEYNKDVDKFLVCIMNRGEVIAWNYYSVIVNLNSIDYKFNCYYFYDFLTSKKHYINDKHSFTECKEVKFHYNELILQEILTIYKNERPSAKVLIKFRNWLCKNSNILKNKKDLLSQYTFNDDIKLESNHLKKIIGE